MAEIKSICMVFPDEIISHNPEAARRDRRPGFNDFVNIYNVENHTVPETPCYEHISLGQTPAKMQNSAKKNNV